MWETIQIIEEKVREIDDIKKMLFEKGIEVYYRSYPSIKEKYLDACLKIKEELSKISVLLSEDESFVENIEDLIFIIDDLIDKVNKNSKETIEDNIKEFRSVLAVVKGYLKKDDDFKFNLNIDNIPEEIRDEVIRDVEEARKCFTSGAYRGTLTFCGRVLETVLSKKYFDKTGVDPMEQEWKLGQIIGKCAAAGILSGDPSIGHFSNLINDTRIKSVHKTQSIFEPGRDETLSLVGLANSLVQKLLK